MKILVVNNYDSFVYNLVHMLREIGGVDLDIVLNDKIDLDSVENYDKILLSPGPGIPAEAGLMPEILRRFSTQKSILGVCLGHQAIAENFGGKLINLEEPLHGVTSRITITAEDYLFHNAPSSFQIGHYHSWVVAPKINEELEIIARDENGNIMAIKHRLFDVRGVQFHPESVLTDQGKLIISNWLNYSK